MFDHGRKRNSLALVSGQCRKKKTASHSGDESNQGLDGMSAELACRVSHLVPSTTSRRRDSAERLAEHQTLR